MRTLILVILLFISVKLLAPEVRCFYIDKAKAIGRFDRLIAAVTWIESKNGLYIWNPTEGAVGWFQIRQVRVDDYNRRRSTHYQLKDFYDYDLSREMFVYYAEQINDFEMIARRWNGSGAATLKYWNLVKSKL
jgi:hypothetical protein